MGIIGIIGVLLGIVILIYLSFKGVNTLLVALLASVAVIVTNGMNFWDAFTGSFAPSMSGFIGSYFMLFMLAAAYGELMKVTGAAESVANTLFGIFGAKYSAIATIFVSAVMAYGGINAFVIVFAIYPVAVPLFRQANISKNLMPGIFLFSSVALMLMFPGAPTMSNTVPTTYLGTTAYAAPLMGVITFAISLVVGSLYVAFASKKLTAKGEGFVPSESDLALDSTDSDRVLPSFGIAILPLVFVFITMFATKNLLGTMNSINTAIISAIIVALLTNWNKIKSTFTNDLATGMLSSFNPLIFTAFIMGFGGVVQAAPAFQSFVDFAINLSEMFNPYVSAAISVNILAGVTGTALGGLQLFATSMLDTFAVMNINPEALHRVLVIACGGLDTLPHCSTIVAMFAVCGVNYKGAYKHVFVLSVLIPLLGTAIAIVLAMVGIV